MTDKREVLCIPEGNMLYAVELEDVEEICFDVEVYYVPCLSDYMRGVFHYNGNMIPIVDSNVQEKHPEEKITVPLALVLRDKKGRFGFCLRWEPFICSISETETVKDFARVTRSGLCEIANIYRYGEKEIYLIDIGKTTENITLHR